MCLVVIGDGKLLVLVGFPIDCILANSICGEGLGHMGVTFTVGCLGIKHSRPHFLHGEMWHIAGLPGFRPPDLLFPLTHP